MKTIALALAIAFSASAASAYEGGWYFDNNPGGTEILDLGDNTDDSYLRLYGTRGWCGSPGTSYANMRATISSNYPYQVEWWIDADCGNAARVCVVGDRGQTACSTYRIDGWW